MIREVTIRRFKRFAEETFRLDGHVVLAGPNNAGKTTLLQAIAAWDLGLNQWRRLNDPHKHNTAYTRAPVARQAFMAVPLRNFELMWRDREYRQPVEIEVFTTRGERVCIEFIPDSTEQIYVRPKSSVTPEALQSIGVQATYVPPMSGLGVEEPVYQRPKIDQLLALQKPGDVLRNLLVEAHTGAHWDDLRATIQRLFGVELLPPDSSGADIVAEFRSRVGGPKLDIRSGGSGFQQVLMLLTFLHTRPGAVLLIDEPDAHLHVYLQDSIYSELRRVAAETGSQLVIATHSEVIINSVSPDELCAMYARPIRLSEAVERQRLANSLGILTQVDVMLAVDAKGVLYLEGHTDLNLLREWSKILGHPAHAWLSTNPFWREIVQQHRDAAPGISAKQHYDSLLLVRNDLPGLELRDGDGEEHPAPVITGRGFQRAWWNRYEAESYLVHPAALERFVSRIVGGGDAALQAVGAMRAELAAMLGAEELAKAFAANPHSPALLVEQFLRTTKARTEIIGRLLTAAGVHGINYTRYSEIAALMTPEEVHPEVREKLDMIASALRLP
jgi:predicted ATPase